MSDPKLKAIAKALEKKLNKEQAAPAPKRSKYSNIKTEVDGIMFDSKREAGHWSQLVMRERAGSITDLQRQIRFELHVNGVKVCTYSPDFQYWEGERLIVADSKGMKTAVYNLKKKMMDAEYGLEILEM